MKQNSASLLFSLFIYFAATAQPAGSTSPELNFSNPVLISGTQNEDNSVYRFALVNNDLDALLTIKGRSSNQVSISQIDMTSSGYGKAFQPRIQNSVGNINSLISWWIEFEISFVTKNTSNPAIVNTFYATAVDIDGDDDDLKEWNAFYAPTNYTVENNSSLITSDFTQIVSGQTTTVGKTFTGPVTEYGGIDTNATQLMATLKYTSTSTIKFRLGAEATSSSANANRMHSVWFKNFAYSNPVTLPVKLNNFQGSKNKNNVMLQWSIGMNEIAGSFNIERSFDGKDFSSVAILFGSEKSGNEVYNYTETTEAQKVYYRLKMTDKSGVISYSKILVFAAAGITGQPLHIVGNIISDKLTISFQSETGQPVELCILDMNGRMILKQKINPYKGNNLVSLSLPSAMNSGMYIATLSAEKTKSTAKFIKQ